VVDLLLSFSYSPAVVGWTAISAGAAGLAALVCALLSVALGRAFGRLYAVFVGLEAVLTAGIAMLLFPQHRMIEEQLALVAFVLALVGAFIATLGAVVAITEAVSWFLAQLYVASGYALIGLWLLIITISGGEAVSFPHRVISMGWLAGIVMALGLAALPGMLMQAEEEQTAPRLVRYIGRAGNLGWLLLFPVWCIWLGTSKL
jgi:hypothetical protein